MDFAAQLKERNERESATDAFVDAFPELLREPLHPLDTQRPFFAPMVGAFADWYFKVKGAKAGVVLDGATGQGKSCLAALIARFAASKGVRPGYLSASRMGLEMSGPFDDPNRKSPVDYLALSEQARLLVIDDVGNETTKQAVEVIRALIEDRVARNQFTAMTSNLERAPLLARFGEREESRFARFLWIHIPSTAIPDLRAVGVKV
jgi:hypothetical protein